MYLVKNLFLGAALATGLAGCATTFDFSYVKDYREKMSIAYTKETREEVKVCKITVSFAGEAEQRIWENIGCDETVDAMIYKNQVNGDCRIIDMSPIRKVYNKQYSALRDMLLKDLGESNPEGRINSQK